jgi:hypothetical protein
MQVQVGDRVRVQRRVRRDGKSCDVHQEIGTVDAVERGRSVHVMFKSGAGCTYLASECTVVGRTEEPGLNV